MTGLAVAQIVTAHWENKRETRQRRKTGEKKTKNRGKRRNNNRDTIEEQRI